MARKKPPAAPASPWEILGVPHGVGKDALRTRYRELAKALHPDRNPGDPAAEARLQEVTKAYRAITAPKNQVLGSGATLSLPAEEIETPPSIWFAIALKQKLNEAAGIAEDAEERVQVRCWKGSDHHLHAAISYPAAAQEVLERLAKTITRRSSMRIEQASPPMDEMSGRLQLLGSPLKNFGFAGMARELNQRFFKDQPVGGIPVPAEVIKFEAPPRRKSGRGEDG